MKTYWIKYPRNFANEYEVGVATNEDAAKDYDEQGFNRITRNKACEMINWSGDTMTAAMNSCTINGVHYFEATGRYERLGARAILAEIDAKDKERYRREAANIQATKQMQERQTDAHFVGVEARLQ